MERRRLEIVVGGFVLLGIAIFCFFVFFISGVYLFKRGYFLNVEYTFVSGISRGAPIRYAGVPVGEVNQLKTDYDENGKPRVVVKIWIKEGTIVRENTKVEIRGAFALSEAHIEISSDGKNEGRILKSGDHIRGIDPVPLDNLIREGDEITKILKNILINVESFTADEEIKSALRDVVFNVDALTSQLNHMLYTSEDDITDAISKAEQSLSELHNTIARTNSIMDSIETQEGTVGKLLYNDEMYNEVLAFIKDIKAHPWKLLKKSKSSSDDSQDKKKGFLGL